MSALADTALVGLDRRSAAALCRAEIARGSKSFALASKLLPAAARDHAAALYTWCRRADDAVDGAPRHERAAALARLSAELELVYAERVDPARDLGLAAFQGTVHACGIPRAYPEALLAGMATDHAGVVAPTLDELFAYCYRVAGVVGLMMSHVMGVRDVGALQKAAALGMAMQLTNIARDVEEDWRLGRLYLPAPLLAQAGLHHLPDELSAGRPLPTSAARPLAGVVRELLAIARRYYRVGEAGILALPWSAGLAVAAASRIYADIGQRLARRGHDVFAGRAVVSRSRKLWLATSVVAKGLWMLPRWLVVSSRAPLLTGKDLPTLRYPDDIVSC
jgi:phytoene synthase